MKHSVPEFIYKSKELMKLIYEIKDANLEDGGAGAFYIYLKKLNVGLVILYTESNLNVLIEKN